MVADSDSWQAARSLRRAHAILPFIEDAYGKSYAENTRETIRRRVLQQFEQARLVDRNPDAPARPTNSGKTCHALTDEALAVIRAYGTKRFTSAAARFQQQQPSLLEVYRAARRRHAIEVVVITRIRRALRTLPARPGNKESPRAGDRFGSGDCPKSIPRTQAPPRLEGARAGSNHVIPQAVPHTRALFPLGDWPRRAAATRSKRSRFITLPHAAAKSRTNFSRESSQA